MSFVWKNVSVGTKKYDDYKVSHSGTVVSIVDDKHVPCFKNSQGDICVELKSFDNEKCIERLDYIVLSSHFRNELEGEVCEHINGRKKECRLMNLRWTKIDP